MKKTLLIMLLCTLFSCYQALEAQEVSTPEASAQEDPSRSSSKGKALLKNALELRDPFKRRINKKRVLVQPKNINNTLFTNQLESIENKPLESMRIVGILVGKERRAVARFLEGGEQERNNVYYIKEGMKLGPNQAEVKAILPGGIVLVEKIRNVYDQDEYLETVIPLSNE